jgi:hypothetical protein
MKRASDRRPSTAVMLIQSGYRSPARLPFFFLEGGLSPGRDIFVAITMHSLRRL